MSVAKKLNGKFVILRNVEASDAEFILSLRCDETKNQYIHAVDNDVDKEIEWIKKQQTRQGDYFYTIVTNKDKFIGNISLYNLDIDRKDAELGRWVSKGAAIENLESVIVLHDFAFDELNLNTIYTKTLQDNKKVVSFWKRFGGDGHDNYNEDGIKYYYNVIDRKDWKEIKKKYSIMLEDKYDG